MSDFSRLRGNERYEVCGDEAGVWPRRNGGIYGFQSQVLPGHRVRHALGIQHLTDAVGRHPGLGQHDDGKSAHHHTGGHQGNILHHGEHIAAGKAGACFHAEAAQVHHQHRRQIQQQCGQRSDEAHGHIAPDDVL